MAATRVVTWSAEYTPGNATVDVRNTEQSPLATLLRLHKGVGGGIAWILLTDSFALAMLALGITGSAAVGARSQREADGLQRGRRGRADRAGRRRDGGGLNVNSRLRAARA